MKYKKSLLLLLLGVCITSCNPVNENTIPFVPVRTESSLNTTTNDIPSDSTDTPILEGGPCERTNNQLLPDGKILLTDRADIFLYDMEKNLLERITDDPSDDDWPAITSDGKTIAFLSNRNHIYQDGLFIMGLVKEIEPGSAAEATMKPVEIVPPVNKTIGPPVWSYDNNWIAYTSWTDSRSYVDIYGLSGGKGTRVRNNFQNNAVPYWSTISDKLYIVNKEPLSQYGSTIEITSLHDILSSVKPMDIPINKEIYLDAGINVKDDREILLTINENDTLGIFIFSIGDGKITPLYHMENDNAWGGGWSPDGKWISVETRYEETGIIYIVNTTTMDRYEVYTTNRFGGFSIVWSPDSQYVAFTSGVNTQNDNFYYMSVEDIIMNSSGCEILPSKIEKVKLSTFSLRDWI
jgi:Tol biopolymer transport system component